MAFRTVVEAKAEMYAGKFILENDGDYAYAIFLYRDKLDMLEARAHYIKTTEYSGYVHCLEHDCPACRKGLREQRKLFIPMLVMEVNGQSVNEVQYWDRNMKFEPVLSQAIFKNYADPSLYVFKITRIGAHGSKDTTYSITVASKNNAPFDKILSDYGVSFPAHYENIIKMVDANTMSQWLATATTANSNANTEVPAYVPTPRVNVQNTAPDLSVLADVEAPFDTDAPFDTEDIDDPVDFG